MQRLGRLPSLGVTRYSLARWVGVSATRRAVLEIKDKEQFQKQVLDSPDPVLVDFHATYGVRMRINLRRSQQVMREDFS